MVKTKDTPMGRRLIGSEWVFKLKRNGVCRSRLIALGHTQMPGVDFTDNFSAVVQDVTPRTALTMWLVLGLDVDQTDVETAFLEGDLKENECVHVPCPQGMDLEKDECLETREGMCGLVQAARVHWKKMCKYLTSQLKCVKNSPFLCVGDNIRADLLCFLMPIFYCLLRT